MAPRLSIITISHNDPAGLAATIAGLWPQWQAVQQDCQWIFVLGRAPDPAIIPAGADILIQPPQGIYAAMNHGLAAATGDYVWFLHGGDQIGGDDLLDNLLNALTENPDILYGDAIELDQPPWRKPAKTLAKMPFGMITHHPAMIFRRDLVPGFDTNFPLAADYKLALTCWQTQKSFVYWPHPIAAVARGGQSEQHAAQGRREQAQIRREVLGWSRWQCQMIVIAQMFSRVVRRIVPGWWRQGRAV